MANYWPEGLSVSLYNKIILNFLRQRAVENYSVVMCISADIQEVLQCGSNKTVQRVACIDDKYGIDLMRMSRGPEALWKNSSLAKLKPYRGQYEKLIDFCTKD